MLGRMAKHRSTGSWADYMKTVGIAIQTIRLRGLSQEQVTYATGVSRYTFQKLEKGESAPRTPANTNLRNVMAIAQVLGVDLHVLLPGPWPDLTAERPMAS